MLASLNEKQLARFVAYLRIKGVDPKDADSVARFISGYEQYCGEEPRPDRDGAVASLKEHIAKEPNAAELGAILNENTEQFADLLTGRAHWEFLNLPDRDGFTPLMRAVQENDEQLVGDLILHGAEVNDRALMPSRNGTSLFALIAEGGSLECLNCVLTSCRTLEQPVDLRDGLEIAANRANWGMLALMLQYGLDVHKRTPIPVPTPALEAAVKRFEPGLQDGAPQALQRMFREALLNRNAPSSEKREMFQLLVDLAQKDRALAVAILSPLVKVGLKISHTLNYDLPELIGLLVEAGANIHEQVGDVDLLVIAIDNEVSLATIEELLKRCTAAGVQWDHDECLNLAMGSNSVPLAGLLLAHGAKPSIEVETWFFEHAD